ncbi:mitogen-activated protein kinase kinase kinase 20-like [Impatiens glandulifera]|uniref:mitogen-activated protein kinase kinase kinase 20-like n=1 Tax=Impatiens glandulifera TaxID=253017 RepID=UPI001FB0A583|nr:mitogen-activated protein kinase kinase kinase 20-like [Impatiens glandulifera]
MSDKNSNTDHSPPPVAWWERGKVIAEGSYGCIVCEARPVPGHCLSLVLPKLMAVKTCKVKQVIYHERDILSLFKRHPHIIHFYGFDSSINTEDGKLMHDMFIEYASGGDMSSRIFTGVGLPEKKVRLYVKGILLGLETIHNLSYAHCDIKPDNILMVDGVVKIADFGIAVKSPTVISSIRGTQEYMSPELIADGYYSCSADIWALGITVLEMLIGKRAWGNKFRKLNMVSIIGVCNIVPEIPKDEVSYLARDFLSRCLVRDYKERWTVDLLLNHPFVSRQNEEEHI